MTGNNTRLHLAKLTTETYQQWLEQRCEEVQAEIEKVLELAEVAPDLERRVAAFKLLASKRQQLVKVRHEYRMSMRGTLIG